MNLVISSIDFYLPGSLAEFQVADEIKMVQHLVPNHKLSMFQIKLDQTIKNLFENENLLFLIAETLL